MATTTPRLLLQKPNPDPVTGDVVDIAVLNANFDKLDSVVSATPCTSSTHPPTPFQGQIILETDTGRMYVWSGAAWVQLLLSAAAPGAFLSHIESQRPTASDVVIRHKLAGDAQYRVQLLGSGYLALGDGANPTDTNLYRRGAGLLGTDQSFRASGVVAGQSWESVRVTTSPNVTGQTEVVIQTVTFPAISGVPYMITAMQNVQSTLLNDLVRVRLKWQAGNTLTAAGSTQLFTTLPNCDVVGRGVAVTMNKVFTPNATGNFTVGITFQRESATAATVISYGENDRSENTIIVAGA